MLTNQLIGAAHNTATHMPRTAPTQDPAPPTAAQAAGTAVPRASDEVSVRALQPPAPTDEIRLETPKLADVQLPKRAELSIAVLDTVPDADPESIYRARMSGDTAA